MDDCLIVLLLLGPVRGSVPPGCRRLRARPIETVQRPEDATLAPSLTTCFWQMRQHHSVPGAASRPQVSEEGDEKLHNFPFLTSLLLVVLLVVLVVLLLVLPPLFFFRSSSCSSSSFFLHFLSLWPVPDGDDDA